MEIGSRVWGILGVMELGRGYLENSWSNGTMEGVFENSWSNGTMERVFGEFME